MKNQKNRRKYCKHWQIWQKWQSVFRPLWKRDGALFYNLPILPMRLVYELPSDKKQMCLRTMNRFTFEPTQNASWIQ